MTDLLELVFANTAFNENDHSWTTGTAEVPYMRVYREFKPMRDTIEINCFFRQNGRRYRMELEFPCTVLGDDATGDEFWRYVRYVIAREIRMCEHIRQAEIYYE